MRRKSQGITLIALIITIIVMLILVSVSINIAIDSGLFQSAGKAKILTTLATIKEEMTVDRALNIIDGDNTTVEGLLAVGKIKRTVQSQGENYYMYYMIRPEAYKGMHGLGKGTPATLRDVFLIDDEFNLKYIDKNGKEYGDELGEKILEDETEIRFASKAFSDYVSKISGVPETKMQFKWMKNQTTLTIKDKTVDSLEDLVFFPNLKTLNLGILYEDAPNITTLNGIENCTKLESLVIRYGPDKDYTALTLLPNLKAFYRLGTGNTKDGNSIAKTLELCSSINEISIYTTKMDNMNWVRQSYKFNKFDFI